MKSLISLVCLASVFASASGEDLFVDSGVVTINPGDVYDTVTVLEPGEVVMNGGEILGEVIVTGTLTMNDGRVVGPIHDNDCNDFTFCGSLIMHGGVIEETVDLGVITMDGGETQSRMRSTGAIQFSGGTAASLAGKTVGDSSGGSVYVTGGTVTGTVANSVFDSSFGIWGGTVSVTNAQVGHVFAGTVGEGAVVGSSSLSIIEEGARVGSADSCRIRGGVIEGNARDCPMTGGVVEGDALVSSTFDIIPWIGFVVINDAEILGDLRLLEWASSVEGTITRAVIHGDIYIPFATWETIQAHAISSQGNDLGLAPDNSVQFLGSDGQPIDVDVVWHDGTQTTNSLFIENLIDKPGAVTFFHVPLTGPGCTQADLVAPYGVLDSLDVQAMVSHFLNADADADLAPPFGTFDLADLSAFIESFIAGCP